MRRLTSLIFVALLAACAARLSVPPAVPVFFRGGSVALDANAQKDVAHAAAVARQYSTIRIKLVGYNLPSNQPAEPVRLSVQRADAVRAELVRDGVNNARIVDYNGGAVAAPIGSSVESRRVDISFIQ